MREKMLGLLIAGLATLTCGSAGGEEIQTPAPASNRTDAGTIIREIQGELLGSASVPYRSVAVSVIDGIVSLTGTVDTILVRRQVVDFARATSGVRGVVNRIEVRPVSRSDEELRDDIKRGLLLEPVTESYEISVSVSSGAARLAGGVDSSQEQLVAVRVAEGIEGIRNVESQLELRRAGVRSDGDIGADVRARLAWDARVDHGGIVVAVEKGRVSLVGDVESARQRADAEADAWVSGVRAVDVSGLEVEGWGGLDDSEEVSLPRSDAEIQRAVVDSFRYDPRLPPCGFEVTASDGSVTLSGVVESHDSRRFAEEDARNAAGVRVVDNRLRVRPIVSAPKRASHEAMP
jgi:osmotically-inducible protein OsmY